MSKEQKIYCKVGQAICEGLGCLAVSTVFLGMFLLYIF